MANAPTLLDAVPSATSAASITIGHTQLRDLLLCPRERGVLNYVRVQSVYEHDILDPNAAPARLNLLSFYPNAIASYILPDDTQLLAAGGAEAELHLSLYAPRTASRPRNDYDHPQPSTSSVRSTDVSRPRPRPRSKQLWKYDARLNGSINNAITLSTNTLNLTGSHESAVEPRVVVSNNDCTVRFYDVAVRASDPQNARVESVGTLKTEFCVNHASMSPDGRTLLSVGDSPQVVLHHVNGSGRELSFTHTTSLTLPPRPPPSRIPCCFSTTFSKSGMQFAVGSQEGIVAVWDVRSSKVMKTFYTEPARKVRRHWMEDPRLGVVCGERAHGFGVRIVKFHAGDNGKEYLTFTEHTSILHVVDAHTYETHDVIRMPSCIQPRLAPDNNPHAYAHTHAMPPLPGSAPPGSRPQLTSSTVRAARFSNLDRAGNLSGLTASMRAMAAARRRSQVPNDSHSSTTDAMVSNVVRETDEALGRFNDEERLSGSRQLQPPPLWQYPPQWHVASPPSLSSYSSNISLRPHRAWLLAADSTRSDRSERDRERALQEQDRERGLLEAFQRRLLARSRSADSSTNDPAALRNRRMRELEQAVVAADWERTSARLRGEARDRAVRLEEAVGEEDEEIMTASQFAYSMGRSRVALEERDDDGEDEVEEEEEDELDADDLDCITTSSSLSPRHEDDSSSGSSDSGVQPQLRPGSGVSLSGRRRRLPVSASGTRSGSGSLGHEEHYEYDVHLAGACFSPSGSHVYVGSVSGITEWSIRDNRRWYSDGAWA